MSELETYSQIRRRERRAGDGPPAGHAPYADAQSTAECPPIDEVTNYGIIRDDLDCALCRCRFDFGGQLDRDDRYAVLFTTAHGITKESDLPSEGGVRVVCEKGLHILTS